MPGMQEQDPAEISAVTFISGYTGRVCSGS